MIKPVRKNLEILQGSTYDKRFAWKAGGVPVDLSAVTLKCQARADVSADETLIEMTVSNGRLQIYDAVGGIFGIYLSAQETAALSFRRAVYDLEVHWASGEAARLMRGVITLDREVTR